MATEISMRELRNHTVRVLEAIQSDDEVYLTNRGQRVAVIKPIPGDWSARVASLLAELPGRDTGLMELLEADNQTSIELEDEGG